VRIHLRFLRKSGMIQEVLERDGWNLEWERDDSLIARHPLVKDETAGRNRLQDLGLLTAASVRIEFIAPKGGPMVSG
jgi:hypothetical protein